MPKRKQASCHPSRVVYATGLCRSCYLKQPKQRAEQLRRNRESYARNKQIKQTAYYATRYGLTLDQLNEFKQAHNNSCDICGQSIARMHIDHDHVTGRIRGLLCGPCNQALGIFGDSIDGLMKAVKYLQSQS